MARGKLRIYLGAAPGVGKTYAMLDEGWRRRERATDVVIGLVVTHDRPKTIAQIRDLETIPPVRVKYRGATWSELDVDAVLARRPKVVLVDELAHTNVPGSRNEKRWQDIQRLLDAGIEVISTVNIQHLESVNDVVNTITGVTQRETVPDAWVRRADQVELVDMSPEALRRRMAHGNIYGPEKLDAALANYFRVGNLGALRELALLWVADRVEDSLQRYMAANGISGPWETRERVLVALTGAPGGDHLIRRAARMARRTKGDLLGVNVVDSDGLRRRSGDLLSHDRALLEELGGSYHEASGDDVPTALIRFAKAHHATQLVLGATRRSRWTELTRGSVINHVLRLAKEIDVHVIWTDGVERQRTSTRRRAPVRPTHDRTRMAVGFVVAAVALTVVTTFVARNSSIAPHHAGPLTSSAGFLIYLGVVIAVAAIGGLAPAIVTALVGAAAVDWYLIPPYGSFAIAKGSDAAYLAAFVVSAGAVAALVEQAARRRLEALRLRDEADAVVALTDRLVQPNPPQAVVEEIQAALSRDAVTLLAPDDEGWIVEASAGASAATRPEDGERHDLRDGHVLVVRGRPLHSDEHRMVAALLSYLEAVMAMDRLQDQAALAHDLSEANDLRAALLRAVSHDLRTPLASIKALTTGWLEPDVRWPHRETHEFMRSIDEEADRLNKLVDNLLDVSRLQTGALHPSKRPIGLDEVIPSALTGLSAGSDRVVVAVPETLPRVDVDPSLLERAVANIVDNALAHSPSARVVRVEADEVAGRVHLRIVDRGTGIPVSQRDCLFQPFQRLGDTDNTTGVGLGLAVAKGFVEALDGELVVEDTPGGGITMVISLGISQCTETTVAESVGL